MSLLVKTTLKQSTIPNAGIGCFTDEFIPKGTKIWEFNSIIDRVYSEKDLSLLTELERDFINKYSYMYKGLYWLCVDNGRFFNHSINECNTIDPPGELCTYASKDIPAGTEILSDYSKFGIDDNDSRHNMDGLIF